MRIFITGTDTGIGKTLVSSWLCLHTESDYFKPIQAGTTEKTDSKFVKELIKGKVYPEVYRFNTPASPHLAAQLEDIEIDINTIKLPKAKKSDC